MFFESNVTAFLNNEYSQCEFINNYIRNIATSVYYNFNNFHKIKGYKIRILLSKLNFLTHFYKSMFV